METYLAEPKPLPGAFIARRLHSLAGASLVLFLIFHLLTNSQAALFIGDDGAGFVHEVNWIHSLPYLPVIEFSVLAIPIFIHLVWGIKYALSSRINSFGKAGRTPYLPYARNRAFTWQRITSWLLVVGVLAHVGQMRFYEKPVEVKRGDTKYFMTTLQEDPGLVTLVPRLGITLYTPRQIAKEEQALASKSGDTPLDVQEKEEMQEWVAALQARPIKSGQVVAVCNSFGMAELLVLRETFKSPLMIFLYTFFVLAASFHAFNGLWTFLISWGVSLTARSQRLIRYLCTALMLLVSFLGLAAIWGTYWVNLRV